MLNYKKISVFFMIFALSFTGCKSSRKEVFGTYNDVTVNANDLTLAERTQIIKAKRQVFESAKQVIEKRYLEAWFTQYKLENNYSSINEAKSNYYTNNINITNEQVDAFIKTNSTNKQFLAIPEDQRAVIVKQYLTKIAKFKLHQSLLKEAYEKEKIHIVAYKPPAEVAAEFNKKNGYIYNPSINRPKMTIVEFADYQCPYCVKASLEIMKFVKANKDNVQFIFMDFPLSNKHPQALPAAIAAKCADKQEKYWEMHEKIFNRAPSAPLSSEMYISFAEKLDLDVSKFKECLKKDSLKKDVNSDKEEGLRVGVNSTPTIFINGDHFDKEITFDNLKEYMDKLNTK